MSNATTLEFPGELVTKALLGHVDLPGVGRFALITLDNGQDHTKPNTFGPAGLTSLNTALDAVEAEAADGSIVGVGVTGKPFIFAVGADLTGVPSITSRADALEVADLGHRTFGRLARLPVPSFAFVNGAALGGGLELALHCSYRTISSGAAAVALPECFLGLLPGWGGATLLPRLIGAEKAIGVIISNALNQNRTLRGPKAFELGIADVMFDPADFLEESLLWAGRVITGATEVSRVPVDTGDHWLAAVAKGRALVESKLHGAAPAPMRALDVISFARTASIEDSFALENEALADLIRSDELRAGLYSFDLVQKRAKRPVGAPPAGLARPVTKVGIVGAGLMASQLALLFAERLEVPVVMTDVSPERIAGGLAWVREQLDARLKAGRATQDRVNRLSGLITGTPDKAAFADANFVIEAVFEEMKVKKQVLDELEQHVGPECVIATNTSSLSVTEMAADLDHPERVVGFHFFNPVAVLPLLEIVRAGRTDDATFATAFTVGRKLKKSCVAVSDRPAFVVNRLLTRFLGEVTSAVDAGTPPAIADRALDSLGLPMSPFTLLALVGPAVALHVSETLHDAFPARYTVSENLRRIVEARKTAIFVPDGKGGQQVDPEILDLMVLGDSPRTAEEVRDACLAALAEEIRIMLDEGVVAEAQDIDLCMILGAGWPFHLGGITPYLDRSGVSEKVTGSRFLPPGIADLG
jgi:3-hydroxyacyl-CoA dehydrogenase/enoyl-CoA hydratase/carnithine racemase